MPNKLPADTKFLGRPEDLPLEKDKELSIFCRMVGPGGTSVAFYSTQNGVRTVWENENCPYLNAGEEANSDGSAPDEHNVDAIPWKALARMVDVARKRGWV